MYVLLVISGYLQMKRHEVELRAEAEKEKEEEVTGM